MEVWSFINYIKDGKRMNGKKLKYTEQIFYILVIVIGVCLPSFFSQIIVEGSSDIGPHTDFAIVMLDSEPEFVWGMPIQAYTYPVYHLVLKVFLAALMGNKVIAASLLLSLCTVFAIPVTRACLRKICPDREAVSAYLIDLISICSVFFIGITGVLTQGRYYLGQGAPNLWHNPTYLMMRPFAWVYFLYACVVLKDIFEEKPVKKDMIMFGITGLILCLIKPSFAIVLLPAAAVITVWLMVKKKSLKPGFLMLAGVGSSLVVLVWQFVYTQTNPLVRDTTEPFAFTLGSYYGFTLTESLSVILAMNGIILLYFIFEGRKHLFKDFYDTLLFFMLLISMLQFFFLTDGSAGNFSWGYYMTVNIGTVLSLVQCIRYRKKLLGGIGGVVFAYQVMMGMVYLLQYYRGGEYLI